MSALGRVMGLLVIPLLGFMIAPSAAFTIDGQSMDGLEATNVLGRIDELLEQLLLTDSDTEAIMGATCFRYSTDFTSDSIIDWFTRNEFTNFYDAYSASACRELCKDVSKSCAAFKFENNRCSHLDLDYMGSGSWLGGTYDFIQSDNVWGVKQFNCTSSVPAFEFGPPPSVTKKEGEQLRMKCKGGEGMHTTWTFADGTELPLSEDNGAKYNIHSSGRLTIRNLDEHDERSYTCTITHDDQSSSSLTMFLDVKVMCNKLDAPLEHGRFLTPDGIYEDEIATYQCDANYVLIGSDSATCMADRTWVTEQPHCKSLYEIIQETNTTLNGKINELMSTFQSDMQALGSDLNAVSATAAALSTTVEGQAGRLEALEARDFDDLLRRLTLLETGQSALTTRVGSAESSNTAISGRVTTLESSGSSRQDSINILLSWKNIFETDVTGRLTALEGENNADSINALQTELESLWRRIHENQTLSLADLQSELVELINNLTQIVGRVEGQQSSQSTSISSLQTTTSAFPSAYAPVAVTNDLRSLINDNDQDISTHTDAIAEINSRIPEGDAMLATVTTTDSLSASLSIQDTVQTGHTQQIADLQADVESQEEDYEVLVEDIEQLNNRIATTETSVANVATASTSSVSTADLATVTARVAATESTLQSHTTTLNSLGGHTDISSLQSQVNSLQSEQGTCCAQMLNNTERIIGLEHEANIAIAQRAVGNTGGWLLAGTPHGYGHGLNIDDISLVVGGEGAGATPNGMTITFNYFDVEPHSSCSYDYFRCYEGSHASGNMVLGPLCGHAIPDPITIPYSEVTCLFHSDGSVDGLGLSLTYTGTFLDTIDWCTFIDNCGDNSVCESAEEGPECLCDAGFTGLFCESEINECESDPCQNGGTCDDLINEFYCDCTDLGYEGDLCESDYDECSNGYCGANVALCTNTVGSFQCTCLPGYSGDRCDIDINECLSSPCGNGDCSHGVNHYDCACWSGWTGDHCTEDINECYNYPCQNGATCYNNQGSYTCQCVSGYEGTTCQTNIDECRYNPCVNGLCNDYVNYFTCSCYDGYEGTYCDQSVSHSAINYNDCANRYGDAGDRIDCDNGKVAVGFCSSSGDYWYNYWNSYFSCNDWYASVECCQVLDRSGWGVHTTYYQSASYNLYSWGSGYGVSCESSNRVMNSVAANDEEYYGWAAYGICYNSPGDRNVAYYDCYWEDANYGVGTWAECDSQYVLFGVCATSYYYDWCGDDYGYYSYSHSAYCCDIQ